MKEQEENNIDKLFKNGITNAGDNMPYSEENWEAMENLLDGRSTRSPFMRRLPLIMSGIAAMLLLLLGWIFFKPAKQQLPVKNTQAKTKISTQKDTGNYGQLTQQPAGYTKINPLSATESIATTDRKNRRKSNSFFTLSAVAAGYTTTGGVSANTTGAIVQPTVKDTTAQPQSTVSTAPQVIAQTAVAATDTVPPQSTVADVPAGKIKISKPAAGGFKPTFAVSVFASSDINSIQSFSQNKLGSSAGVTLTIGVSKKWNITTGAFYADKPYQAPFSAYNMVFRGKFEPTTVQASCLVLDIPLNVGYQVYNKSKNKLSLGAGLSSYFMLRESYTFNYAQSAYGPPATSYTIRNQNRHLFGVANINATYQRKVSAKLDLGVQPYLKLPLTQIGYGQVNLKSAGVAVGLMWNLNSHTKP